MLRVGKTLVVGFVEVFLRMAENSFGDFFLSDADDEISVIEGGDIQAAVSTPSAPGPFVTPEAPAPVPTEIPPTTAEAPSTPPDELTPDIETASVPVAPTAPTADLSSVPAVASPTPTAGETRERRLADALNQLMDESPDIQAAALVSLDGFTMASALPEGMQEDRVGAMSAAILGLGERAAIELGRGKLSQVFIEGEGGYVLLMAAGTRSVLTCLADEDAKLGLLLYDMRAAAEAVGEILG